MQSVQNPDGRSRNQPILDRENLTAKVAVQLIDSVFGKRIYNLPV
ncbi:hypothetical protein [Thermoactinomyces mirandus]|nr:hypothetical protein [Thermoactinomyces mirandus]